ncbi:MlaD family protein [Mycolicibacterium brumae]|uniref:MCE family protein n=1 Tax=Mycolicibacterium brumae TaxID=85968 RepID=A0A2G5PD40_9MYCO|nr:MlaD family protein [Mycolicibacterium brumae]MCV7191885.1 MCE family protein [Mycolicibacterium brumae]PIB76242.1 MCE family protein [Mycolicibacterium brumae]RWA15736.1 hypothetical protein MBRU_09295 [Mycolicibacterium brumae DSM 44177]UWW07191.1 MCE family protein [Mycolicibacterium brumae]
MRQHRNALIGLALFTISAIVLSSMVYVTLSRGVAGSTHTFRAVFSDASGLKPSDDVRVAGVRVGRVEKVDLVDVEVNGRKQAAARVTFAIQSGQQLFDNTIASVTYQNIIGQRYLGLATERTPDRHPLAPDSEIPIERTVDSFDIAYLLNGFEPLFTLLDPGKVDNMTEGVVQALQGDSTSVLELITSTSTLAQSLAGPDEVLGRVLDSLRLVVDNLADHESGLRGTLSNASSIVRQLESRHDQLLASVGSINSAVGQLSRISENVTPDLLEMIQRQPGWAAHVAGPGRERMAYALYNVPAVMKGIARVTQSGEYINAYVCDLNSTIFDWLGRYIPAVVAGATDGHNIKHSAKCRS